MCTKAAGQAVLDINRHSRRCRANTRITKGQGVAQTIMTIKRVITCTTTERVISVRTDDMVDTGDCIHSIARDGARIAVEIDRNRAGDGAEVIEVITRTADNTVITATGINQIVAITGVDHIIAGTTVDRIIACTGDDAVRTGTARDRVSARTCINNIVAILAVDQIVALTTEDGVITATALNRVITDKRTVRVITINDIVTTETKDRIVSAFTIETVTVTIVMGIGIVASDKVILIRTGHILDA